MPGNANPFYMADSEKSMTLAININYVFAGIGQLYLGDFKSGIPLILMECVIWIGFLYSLIFAPGHWFVALGLLIMVNQASVWHVKKLGERKDLELPDNPLLRY